MGITTQKIANEETQKAKEAADVKIKVNEVNLSLWDKVKDTDQNFVTPIFSANGNLSSINHNYQIMRATNLFGPCGLGWGYDIINEDYVKGAALFKEHPESGNHTLHVVRIKFWYKPDGYKNGDKDLKGEVTHFGQTVLSNIDSAGIYSFDENAPKKSLTDAIGKCLSMLGFSADIYSGQADSPANPQQKVAPKVLIPTEASSLVLNSKTNEELAANWANLTPEDRSQDVCKQAKEDAKKRLT